MRPTYSGCPDHIMSHLPVIVSFGGIGPAGRSSSHMAYQRLVFDKLAREDQLVTLQNLAVLMNLITCEGGNWTANGRSVALGPFLQEQQQQILAGTLIRKLETNLFDPAQLLMQNNVTLGA